MTISYTKKFKILQFILILPLTGFWTTQPKCEPDKNYMIVLMMGYFQESFHLASDLQIYCEKLLIDVVFFQIYAC